MRCWLIFAVWIVPWAAWADWRDDPKYPEWAQRGRIIYLDGVRPTEEHLRLIEQMKDRGATPFIHAFTPHWPYDPALVERMAAKGIPVDVRVEASNFFENDNIDRFASIHGKFLPGGWWYNHAWRTNYDWYRLWPETIQGSMRRRNGDDFVAYLGHRVTVRRDGSPLAPEHRQARAQQIAWLLSGVDPLPQVPMRSYENLMAKDPKVPYPMLGRYVGLWYDNPSSGPTYDVASRAAWERHFQEKFGQAIWDPPSHPDRAVRREWGRFWANAWVDYFRWRKQYQDELARKRGLPFAFASGNFSALSNPHGTTQFYQAKHGIVDMLGPSEYLTAYNRGRFHFLLKTALAATHGRPAGKFYPNDLQIAESLAVGGTNTYRPEAAQFLVENVRLYQNVQPGGRLALLFHTEQNLLESQLVNLQELVDQITDLGYPYEVVIEDDLGADLARQFPALLLSNVDLTPQQAEKLREYLKSGGRAALIGDCLVEKPACYPLDSPPPWQPDQTLAARLQDHGKNWIVSRRQAMGTPELGELIEKLGGPGFRLERPDPDVLLNVLRQPAGGLTLLGLVNYSGAVKQNTSIRLQDGLGEAAAGWISRDGGARMLQNRGGQITVPELGYGGTIVLGRDRPAVEAIVKNNQEQVSPPPPPPKAVGPRAAAMQYGVNYAKRLQLDQVLEGQTLCRYRVGASDRRGYLMLDVLGPRQVQPRKPAEFTLHVLDTTFDYVEYWQLILENTETGVRVALPIRLPDDNPHGQRDTLIGSTLRVAWTPGEEKAGIYQAHVAYRVVSLSADGEPFLEPPEVAAGYSGKTPANLFLKGKPLMKRPYEDRLRGLQVELR